MLSRRRYIVVTFPNGSEELFTSYTALVETHPQFSWATMRNKFKIARKRPGYGKYTSDEIWYKGCHIRRLWVNDKLIADANDEN